MSARRTPVADPRCWGLFREREHSPGRESDDAEILRLTGKHLESYGVQVELRAPEDLVATDVPPDGVFFMCERMEALRTLLAWQERGVRLVNSPQAVLNTYRERMITQLREANVAFVPSRLVATSEPGVTARLPVWVKRADVHNTQDGDVVFAETPEAVASALAGLAARGIEGAVLQPHVAGDLIKFYGVGPGGGGPDGGPPWFRWFYHKDQRLAGHAFDAARLARLVRDLQGVYISQHLPINQQLTVLKTAFIAHHSNPAARVDFNAFTNIRRDRNSHVSDQLELSYFGEDSVETPGSSARLCANRAKFACAADPVTVPA